MRNQKADTPITQRLREIYMIDPKIHWRDIQRVLCLEFPDSLSVNTSVFSMYAPKQRKVLYKAGVIPFVKMRRPRPELSVVDLQRELDPNRGPLGVIDYKGGM